jgi:beta-alanine degradation protein BauB
MTKMACLTTGLLAGVLLSTAAFSMLADAGSLDPAKLAPAMYKVVLENDKLRAIDYHLKPGEQEPMHSHPCGVLVYFFTDANMASPLPEGKISENHNRAGDVVWRAPVTHSGKNVGNSEVHTLLVEPKESCKH